MAAGVADMSGCGGGVGCFGSLPEQQITKKVEPMTPGCIRDIILASSNTGRQNSCICTLIGSS